MQPYPTTIGGGIYAISHVPSGRQYVGSAKSFSRRWSIHFRAMKAGKHPNRRLRQDVLAYGPDAFTFIVLESVSDPKLLVVREQHYIDTLRPYYNLAPTAGSPLGCTRDDETRARISAALKGRRLDPEWRAKVAEANRSPEKRAAVLRATKGKPSPKRGWKNAYMSQEQFIAAYPVMPSSEIAAHCHTSEAWVTQWAKKLGLPPRYREGGTGLLKPRVGPGLGKWAPGRECCAQCGTTDHPYKAHGLCEKCYRRQRTLRANPNASLGRWPKRDDR